jgi:hypothetical protein
MLDKLDVAICWLNDNRSRIVRWWTIAACAKVSLYLVCFALVRMGVSDNLLAPLILAVVVAGLSLFALAAVALVVCTLVGVVSLIPALLLMLARMRSSADTASELEL